MALQYNDIVSAQTAPGFDLATSAQQATTPGAITLDQLKPVTPINLPPTPAVSTGKSDALVSGVQTGQKSLQSYIDSLTVAPTQADTQQQSILNQIAELTGQNTGKNQALAQEKINAGIPVLQTQLQDLNNKINIGNSEYARLSAEAYARKTALEAGAGQGGLTTGLLGGQQGAVERNYAAQQALKASEIAMNAAQAQAVSGNMQTAITIAQNAVEARYAPIEDALKVKQAQLEALQPILNKQEKIQAEALNRKYAEDQAKIAEDKANQKAISEMVVNASAQGASQDIVNQASQAKTSLEAAKILGKYSGDFLKYEMLKEQIKTEGLQQAKIKADTAKTYADIKKIKSDIVDNNPNVTPAQAGKYAGALSVILGSDKFTKEQKAAVTNAINNGQDPFAVIKNQAKNIMGQTNATKLDNYETAKAQIESIQNNLEQFYSQGGKTGLFNGNYEKTLNSLGQVSDPKLVGLATEISSALQIYRNAVSGTAYSVQEGKDIASIFPGINKTKGLNKAVLSGRLKAFETSIDSTYRNVLGSSYDDIKNVGSINTPANIPNPFSQALGSGQSFNTAGSTGMSIISGLNQNGTLNFKLPK